MTGEEVEAHTPHGCSSSRAAAAGHASALLAITSCRQRGHTGNRLAHSGKKTVCTCRSSAEGGRTNHLALLGGVLPLDRARMLGCGQQVLSAQQPQQRVNGEVAHLRRGVAGTPDQL